MIKSLKLFLISELRFKDKREKIDSQKISADLIIGLDKAGRWVGFFWWV